MIEIAALLECPVTGSSMGSVYRDQIEYRPQESIFPQLYKRDDGVCQGSRIVLVNPGTNVLLR